MRHRFNRQDRQEFLGSAARLLLSLRTGTGSERIEGFACLVERKKKRFHPVHPVSFMELCVYGPWLTSPSVETRRFRQ